MRLRQKRWVSIQPKLNVRAFVIGAFFAGVAGGLFAHYLRYLNPQTFDFNRSFEIIIMVVLGGMGSITGSVVAAIFLTGIREALRPLQEITKIDFRMVIYSLMLILLMLTRPNGLFGSREFIRLPSKPPCEKAERPRVRSMSASSQKELALNVENLTMQFGGLKAVSELSLTLPQGIIFGLIGPNGAGKTTAFNMLTGVYKPTSGTIQAFGHSLVGLKPAKLPNSG